MAVKASHWQAGCDNAWLSPAVLLRGGSTRSGPLREQHAKGGDRVRASLLLLVDVGEDLRFGDGSVG